MRILGIDPGSHATGYGVVERIGPRLSALAHGALCAPRGQPPAVRLAGLQIGLLAVIEAHRPDVAVVERVFVARNARTALVLGEARGAALAAAGRVGLPVVEVSASQIKRAVTSTGRAGKEQVRTMVARLLGLDAPPQSDAADALAAAIYHAHAGPLAAATPAARRRRPRARELPVRGGLP